MTGPLPHGHWRDAWENSADEFQGLRRRRWYRVVKEFSDFDGDVHPEGETWLFLGHNFLPYEDGLSLFISLDGHQEWHIRMRWTSEDQGLVIDAMQQYLTLVD